MGKARALEDLSHFLWFELKMSKEESVPDYSEAKTVFALKSKLANLQILK